MTAWTPLNKGDKRPQGRVLVTFDASTKAEKKLYAAIFGFEQQPDWSVGVAYWSPEIRKWMTGRGSIENVTAWAPLPEPYEVKDNG